MRLRAPDTFSTATSPSLLPTCSSPTPTFRLCAVPNTAALPGRALTRTRVLYVQHAAAQWNQLLRCRFPGPQHRPGHPVSGALPASVGAKRVVRRSDLSDNQLSTIPTGFFDRLTALSDLSVATAVPRPSCPARCECAVCTRRSLVGNVLTSLPAGLFDHNTQLARLCVRGARVRAALCTLRGRCGQRIRRELQQSPAPPDLLAQRHLFASNGSV